ncbi:MAG: ABC transporter permease [Gemmatimonadetes bacterium]|nr:ABC transporter permease [Gemmatimonadota bacterium]
MPLLEGVRLALAQIRAQKLKSFFSLIGVLIGVMFLMTVVSVVEGLDRYMKQDFARTVYGLNTVTVRRRPSVWFSTSSAEWRQMRRRPRLTFDDLAAVRQQLGVPALVAASSDAGGRIEAADGTEVENVWLTGATADYFRIREYEVGRGRLFTGPEDELGAAAVVLGHEAAEKLFGALDPIGRMVRIKGSSFRVIGVLEKQGSLFGMSLDNRAVAPARSAISRMVNPHRIIDEILIRATDAQGMARALLAAESIMRARHRLRPGESNDFEIETAEDSMSFWTRISRILYVAFPGLVAIALVVGGMVIMNIMLVSVAERTREIGVRKALGARRRDILLQVLIESATLSGLGAMIGILLGVGLAQLVRAASPLPAAIALHWIGAAALLGVGVGVLAGLYPAARAAAMDPIVALRHE